jgi:hypothetical protein
MQIPKEQKKQSTCQSFLRFWDLEAAQGTLMKLTPGLHVSSPYF